MGKSGKQYKEQTLKKKNLRSTKKIEKEEDGYHLSYNKNPSKNSYNTKSSQRKEK